MPTTVGILTFIGMIITTSERPKQETSSVVGIVAFVNWLKFRAQLSWAWKKFITSGPDYYVKRMSWNCSTAHIEESCDDTSDTYSWVIHIHELYIFMSYT